MAGLMVLFLFIAISYMVKTQNENEMYISIEQEYAIAQDAIYKALFEEFKDDLDSWDARIDKENLSFIFLSPDVLFETGKSTIQKKYMDILDDFFPRYISSLDQVIYPIEAIILNEESGDKELITVSRSAKDNISAIRIEGHANKDAPEKYFTPNQKFVYNMRLSSDRSQSVLTYVLNLDLSDQHSWVRDNVRAVGYSSSNPVYTDDIYDYSKSKRVEFRIVLNAQERLFELIQKNKEGKLNEINYLTNNDILKSQMLDKYREELRNTKEDLLVTRGLLSELDRKLVIAQKELATTEEKINNLKSENVELERERKNINRTISILKKERDRIVIQNNELTLELDDVEENLNSLDREKSFYQQEIEMLKEEITEMNGLHSLMKKEVRQKIEDGSIPYNNDISQYDNKDVSTPAKIIGKIEPIYPKGAQESGVTGTVTVSFYIDRKGRAQDVRVTEGAGSILNRATIFAVQRANWIPATENGEAVIEIKTFSATFE